MARSMIKRRQEVERERIEAYQATLRTVSSEARPAPDFAKALKEAKRGFVNDVIRDCASWRPKMKSRDAARLRLAAARHLFARYPVPSPLEKILAFARSAPRSFALPPRNRDGRERHCRRSTPARQRANSGNGCRVTLSKGFQRWAAVSRWSFSMSFTFVPP